MTDNLLMKVCDFTIEERDELCEVVLGIIEVCSTPISKTEIFFMVHLQDYSIDVQSAILSLVDSTILDFQRPWLNQALTILTGSGEVDVSCGLFSAVI